ncbi:MAG TPA: hypothetical protein VFB43_19850 [Terracidiphilus sp.]|nr:hypothetical protein [Terracidiphilus sp.]
MQQPIQAGVDILMLIKDPFRSSAAYACVGFQEHPMTLLEELQAWILARANRENESGPIAATSVTATASQAEELNPPTGNTEGSLFGRDRV